MQTKASRQAFRVALIYITVAGAYIWISNELVKMFVSNPDERVRLTILKGWIFVLVTGALWFWVLRRVLGRWQREMDQRNAAEAQLHASRDRYALVEQATQDGQWDWNILTDEDYFSPRWKEIIGYRNGEIPNQRSAFLNLLHPDDRAMVQEATRGKLEQDRRYEVEFRLRHKDGSYRWVLSRGEAVRDAAGRPIRLVGSIRDITERKQLEAQTRAFAQLSQRLSVSTDPHDAADAVTGTALELFDWDACFLLLYDAASDAVRELINKDTINNQRLSVPVAMGLLHPTPTLRRVMAQGGQLVLRQDATDDAGTTRHFGDMSRPSSSLMYVALRHQGQVTGFLSVQSYRRNAYSHQDMVILQALADQCAGAIKRIETEAALRAALTEAERFRAAMDEVHACVFMKDNQSRYLYANRPTLELFGCSAEGLAGRDDAHFFPPDTARRIRDMDERVFRGEQVIQENDIPDARGGRRVYWDVKTPIYSDAKHQTVCGLLCISTDITERKLIEQKLRESEQKFSRMFNSNPVSTALTTIEEGRYLDVNPEFLSFVQRSREEVIGHTSFDLGLWVDTGQRAAIVSRLAEHGSVRNAEFEVRTKSGQIRQVLWSGEEVVIGGERCMVGSMLDITERKAAEAALRDSEERHRLIFAMESDAIFLVDRDTLQFIDVNLAAERMYGYSRAEFLQMKATAVSAEPEKTLGNLGSEITQTPVLLHRRKDGTVFPVEVSDSVLEYQNRTIKIGTMRDITERKRIEESHTRLATAIEQAAETVVITDTKGAILYANPAFESSSGYTRAEALGQNPRLLKSGKHDAGFYQQMWATLLHGEVWCGHLVNRRKDGTLFEEEATISPIRDSAGAVINYVAVKRDVTHEVQLEAQIRQSQKMEAIGTLAGGIAHDFNNMLGAMFGYAYLLQQDTEGNPLAQESVGEILKAATRAKELVQQILTFSRQRDSSRQVMRLDAIIKEAMKFMRASLPANLRIETELAPEAPAVLADPTQIYQVTMNLATNALHAMEGRTGQLSVTLEPFQPDAEFLEAQPQLRPIQYARLTIADNGHGMDAKTLERIYEPFFTTKPVGKGTGLGLSVVHGIMKSHEGVITVESEAGQGTTFRLYFPAQTQGATVAGGDGADGRGHGSGRGQRILLLDDEPALTAMLQKALRRLEYQVATCNHPGEAIRRCRENPAQFDLVITDLTMPEINGLEVARQLRAICPGLPVILVSGYSVAVHDDSLREAGIRKLLQKPVSLSALAEAVQRVLKNPR